MRGSEIRASCSEVTEDSHMPGSCSVTIPGIPAYLLDSAGRISYGAFPKEGTLDELKGSL